jgi:hypothetical protein
LPVAELIAGVVIAALLLLAFGFSPLNGDMLWALEWGRQLAEGTLPSYTHELAATPHPLATLLGLLLSVFGRDGAYTGAVVVGYLSYGFLLAGAFRLGRVSFSWPVGLMAAIVLATSISLLSFAVIGYLDVTASALAVWAAALESERPRRGTAVLVLLAIAGLQRPEMWVLSGVYWLYLTHGRPLRERAGSALLAASAPLLWVLGDFLVTGEPLFSFHFTHAAVADFVAKEGGSSKSLGPFGDSLRSILRAPGVLGALVGLALAVVLRRRRAGVTVALTVLSGLAIEAQALAGLAILDRFLFTTAAGLAVLFGFAVFGWSGADAGSALRRRAWAVGGLAILALYLATAPPHLKTQANAPDRLEPPKHAREQVKALTRDPRTRAVLDRCGPVRASPVLTPYLVYYLEKPPSYVVARAGRGSHSYVRARTRDAALFSVAPRLEPSLPGYREAARNRSWSVLAGSCATAR